MARIKLSDYSVISEGRKIFLVESAEYDEDFGKLKINLVTEDGQKHTERYSLLTSSGEANGTAISLFTAFAKIVLNDFEVDEIDEQDLVGHYFVANVIHEKVPSKKDPTKLNTYARLRDCGHAEDFDDEDVLNEEVPETPVAPVKKEVTTNAKPIKPSVVDLSILDD